MRECKIIIYAIICLVFCCTVGCAQNYNNCTGDIEWIGDAYCDLGNNDELCGYDGGKLHFLHNNFYSTLRMYVERIAIVINWIVSSWYYKG